MTLCLKVMPGSPDDLSDCSANCCPTSPPYWMQRNYGVAGQIGREETVEQYLHRLGPCLMKSSEC